jgi:predicted DNA binding CopG/RHH family protein
LKYICGGIKMKKSTAKRNDKIEIVLNEEEKRIIVRQATNEGLPVSTYIRWKLLKKS